MTIASGSRVMLVGHSDVIDLEALVVQSLISVQPDTCRWKRRESNDTNVKVLMPYEKA